MNFLDGMRRVRRGMQTFLSWLSKAALLRLMFWMILASLFEGIGLVLLLPMIELLTTNGTVEEGRWLHAITDWLPFNLTLPTLLCVFVVLIALRGVVLHRRDVLSSSLVMALSDKLRMATFAAVLRAEWRWLVTRRQTDHASAMTADVMRVAVAMQFFVQWLSALVTLLGVLVLAVLLSPMMTVVALFGGVLILLLLQRQRQRAITVGTAQTTAQRAMQAAIQESLAGVKLAKILAAEDAYLREVDRTAVNLRRQQLAFVRASSLSRHLFQLGGAVLLAGALAIGVSVWQVPLAELTILVLLFARLIPALSSAEQAMQRWLNSLPAIESIAELLREAKEVEESGSAVGSDRIALTQHIRLDRVTLRYPQQVSPALKDLSLEIPARQTTAITGESGAGKSTLADVLMGLILPDAGKVLVDGIEVTGERRAVWRRSVSYVPQDVFMFHDSIRNNLLLACPDADESELREALQRASADFVFTLPLGLDTLVGDGGVRLSGGERQRIALARALLGRPSLLILDEATSALDVDNERRVCKAIANLHGELTLVVIGHRTVTLEHADQLIKLEHGQLRQ